MQRYRFPEVILHRSFLSGISWGRFQRFSEIIQRWNTQTGALAVWRDNDRCSQKDSKAQIQIYPIYLWSGTWVWKRQEHLSCACQSTSILQISMWEIFYEYMFEALYWLHLGLHRARRQERFTCLTAISMITTQTKIQAADIYFSRCTITW